MKQGYVLPYLVAIALTVAFTVIIGVSDSEATNNATRPASDIARGNPSTPTLTRTPTATATRSATLSNSSLHGAPVQVQTPSRAYFLLTLPLSTKPYLGGTPPPPFPTTHPPATSQHLAAHSLP